VGFTNSKETFYFYFFLLGRVGFSKELFVFGGWGLDWFWLFLGRGGTLCKRLIYLFIFGMGLGCIFFFLGFWTFL
jgi:hypothetical protein